MKGHMNNEQVHSHAEAVLHALKEQHGYSTEQVRRICTTIVKKLGSLRACKQADLEAEKSDE